MTWPEIGYKGNWVCISTISNWLPRLTALENVALPFVFAGLSKKMRNKKAMEVLDMVN